MANVQHVYRRGHVFWWRRVIRFLDGRTVEVRLSLQTLDRREARNRGAALTAQTMAVTEMLEAHMKPIDARPTEAELKAMAAVAYNERLGQFCDEQRANPQQAAMHSAANLAYADYYHRLATNGGSIPFFEGEEEQLAAQGWDDQRIERLRVLVERTLHWQNPIKDRFIDPHLQSAGYVPQKATRDMVRRILPASYRDACLAAQADLQDLVKSSGSAIVVPDWPGSGLLVQPSVPPTTISAAADVAANASGKAEFNIPLSWRDVSPTEAAERYIEAEFTLLQHRSSGKRAKAQTGEQTLRQIRWASVLLERSMSGRPFWTLQMEDLVQLDAWFDKLPVTCGKAPRHRDPGTTLEAICLEAEDRIERGECDASIVGLSIGTSNKHFRKLAQIHDHMRGDVPEVAKLPFDKFISPEVQDEREAREAYTLGQGEELFRLPPWTGCSSAEKRLSPGTMVFHDSLYFVLLLVWYTGMRREEVCKLLVSDIVRGDIPHISIAHTEAGRVKGPTAVRLIAISDELIRLRFLDYVDAIAAAGHKAVFPELVSERAGAKKGDTFYKLWWIYLRSLLPSLKRGQALHSARHMVSTELKNLGVFAEFRNDALGHKGEGEGVTRYSKATRLGKLKTLVDQIPVVTDHLPSSAEIKLLPAHMRCPRPVRAATISAAASERRASDTSPKSRPMAGVRVASGTRRKVV